MAADENDAEEYTSGADSDVTRGIDDSDSCTSSATSGGVEGRPWREATHGCMALTPAHVDESEEPPMVRSFDSAVDSLMEILQRGAVKCSSGVAMYAAPGVPAPDDRPPRSAVAAHLISEWEVRECLEKLLHEHEQVLHKGTSRKLEVRAQLAARAKQRFLERCAAEARSDHGQQAWQELEAQRLAIEKREQALREREQRAALEIGGGGPKFAEVAKQMHEQTSSLFEPLMSNAKRLWNA
eukprot:TRINITY_DN9819_c0_g1_i1.p1 TRINITY_DN9819_c0_g1~~TRINITY_DN9819_c0_g1_i1.p1  ORF type:complete len:240 (-),score=64.59 TRINITY_DN9819_c0_g1_i1:643-1362(-)